MSEPKLISPLLDNFVMGDPISDCNGVRCCPAMENETNEKYIVKIVSTPASQKQLDALLLSGAYSDKESVLSYFESVANSIVDEAEILQKLSQLEGFVPFKAWQTVPMDGEESGFDVYLVSTYRKTLARHFRCAPTTHLGALNLGLDLCAAMAICRHSGYLYVNLKPDNIYITDDQEFRVGDLGFLKLDSLKYTSLPDRYRSQYTAPEIADAFSALNTTVDVYAIGLILYQTYNDGNLPFSGETAPDEEFPAPAYADYEMSEIILKACAPDPEMRWQNPIEMGQALVSYMQRNGANDTPIAPVAVDEEPKEIEENLEDTENTQEPEITETTEELENNPETSSDAIDDADEKPTDETSEATSDDTAWEYNEDADGNFSFLTIEADDEIPADDELAQIDYEEISDEVSDMLTQADDLIAHPTPDPVVQPEAIDVPIPPPIVLEEDAEDDPSEDVPDKETDEENSSPEDTDDTPVKKQKKTWLRNAIIVVLLLAVAAAGLFFYREYYLQPIESILLEDNNDGELTVLISSKIDEEKLTVLCSDTYGNQLTSPVVNGKATFTGLVPNSAYSIKVETKGFHRLTGDTSAAYTTPIQTNIVQFNAVTGSEDGSVILSFAIDGPDSKQWKISYTADNGETKDSVFSGHMLTLNGLTIGKEYTFTLTPLEQIHMTGTSEITHTASKIIKADRVQITGCINKKLTTAWSVPENVTVKSWTVRCYNNSDFDKTVVTEETNAAFEITDPTKEYTVEVTAAGMSVSQRAYAAANSATVTDFNADIADPNKMVLSWKPVGDISCEGWILIYTVDNSSPKELICGEDNILVISPVIPGGKYAFTLQTAEGKTVLGGALDYNVPKAKDFEGYAVSAEYMQFMMCKRPSYSGWNRYDLADSDYRTKFTTEEKASYLIKMLKEYNTSNDTIHQLFVIRDASGAIVSTETNSDIWVDMWYRNYCELDIPSLPEKPGKYTISVYFNGQFANENNFTIVKD